MIKKKKIPDKDKQSKKTGASKELPPARTEGPNFSLCETVPLRATAFPLVRFQFPSDDYKRTTREGEKSILDLLFRTANAFSFEAGK